MLSENKNHSKYITWNYYFSNLKNNNQKLKKKYSVNSFIKDEVDFVVLAYEDDDITNM